MQKLVTRTIHITEPGKPTVTTTQTGSIKRTATLNDKDDKVQFSAWTPDGNNVWEAKTVPTVAGYTTVIEQLETNEDGTVTRNTLTSIPELTVDGSTLPTTINVTYTANPQSVLINFVDDDNLFEGEPKVVKSDTIDGVTEQNISLNLSVPEHYVLAENQTLPTDYTFTAAKNKSITIHLKEKVDQVTDPVQLNKTISRKITIKKPG